MDKNRNLSGVFLIIGLVAAMAVARIFDALLASLARRNAQTFSLTYVIFGAYIVIGLVLAAFLLLLFWAVLRQSPRAAWVSIVFLVVGLFVVASPILYFTPLFCCLPSPLESLLFPASAFTSYTVWAGGFIAITGLFALILPKGKSGDK